jgi:hypothetical protein
MAVAAARIRDGNHGGQNEPNPDYREGVALDPSLEGNIRGCKAEMAVAKYFGVYWAALAGIRARDVGTHGEVKAVKRMDADVWVRESDVRDRLIIVSVYATTAADDGRVTLRGWLPAAEAPSVGTHDGKRSWVVNPHHLRPVTTLTALDLSEPAWYAARDMAWEMSVAGVL